MPRKKTIVADDASNVADVQDVVVEPSLPKRVKLLERFAISTPVGFVVLEKGRVTDDPYYLALMSEYGAKVEDA